MDRKSVQLHALVIVAVLASFSAIGGCGDDDTTKPKPRTCPYTGISQRDAQGNVLSEDPDDWCYSGPDTEPRMHPAYPNPCSQTTTIRFHLPQTAEVSLKIFSTQCNLIRTLQEDIIEAGPHTMIWELRDNSGADVPAGIYRCVMRVSGVVVCHGDIQVE